MMFAAGTHTDLMSMVERALDGFKAVGPDLFAALLLLVFGLFSAFVMKKAALFAIDRLRRSQWGRLTQRLDTSLLDTTAIGLSRLTFWLTIFVFLILTAQIFDRTFANS